MSSKVSLTEVTEAYTGRQRKYFDVPCQDTRIRLGSLEPLDFLRRPPASQVLPITKSVGARRGDVQ